MKKLVIFSATAFLFLFVFVFAQVAQAKSTCNMLPGNIQCWRSWCGFNQTEVCESNSYCYCYDPGETIQEGSCAGQPADPSNTQGCVNYTSSIPGLPGVAPSARCIPGVPIADSRPPQCHLPFISSIVCSGIYTAIGCIPVSGPSSFISFILGWSIGIGGGIALILIVYAGFMITTSSGDPQKLNAGKELLTAAISGLLLLIFSVYILRVIGVDILKLEDVGL